MSHSQDYDEAMKSCTRCDLHENRTQVVVGDYGPENGLCFIGEAPGYNEDKQGRPFVGRSGKLLDEMLNQIGMDRTQVSVLNIVKCRPPKNRTPYKKEMRTCGNLWLDKQIEHLQPRLLITLGSVALNYFFPKLKMTQAKGRLQVSSYGIPLYPLFHPAYILRNGNKMKQQYLQDFEQIIGIKQKLDQLKKSDMENQIPSTDQDDISEFF